MCYKIQNIYILGSHTRPLKSISAPLKAKHFIDQLWQLMTASDVGARTQAWQAKWAVFKIPAFISKHFLPYFPHPSPVFHLRHFSGGLWLSFLVLCSLTARKRLLHRLDWARTYIRFPTSMLHACDVRSEKIWKSWKPMRTSQRWVDFIVLINWTLRYCGIKVNGSKEKPSWFLQVQLISEWLTFDTITV